MTSNMNIPCLDCADRCIGCHATCENYKTWAQDRREWLDKIYKQKNIENKVESHAINTHHKIKRSGVKSKLLKGTKK